MRAKAIKAIDIEDIDITGNVGPLFPPSTPSDWPMYSFNRPAYTFWNGFAKGLAKRGLSIDEIKVELQSKGVRLMLDVHSDKLEAVGEDLAMDYDFYVPLRGE